VNVITPGWIAADEAGAQVGAADAAAGASRGDEGADENGEATPNHADSNPLL
jgi:hypothetical protein